MEDETLKEQVTSMRPWHHDIELNERLSTGKVFSPSGELERPQNDGVSAERARIVRVVLFILQEKLS